MPNYYVAKSYQTWPVEGEVFENNGKMYLKVRNPKGEVKQVRAYSEMEYRRLYKETCASPASQSGVASKPQGPVVKNILGFQEGYIWIFKGDLENAEYWFEKTPECRFHVIFGWYIVSTDSIPFDIPSCIESVKLPWEKVGNTDGTLLPKSIIEAAINDLRYETTPSQFQGTIGERLSLELYYLSNKMTTGGQYGPRYEYRFQDANANIFIWNTGVAKEWEVGNLIKCKAGIKSHDTIRGIRITTLTRLMEEKKK